MKLYYRFMFGSYYLAKGKEYFDPKFYVSSLSLTFILLLLFSVFNLIKIIIPLSTNYLYIFFVGAIIIEKLNGKFFNKVFLSFSKDYEYLEHQKGKNVFVIVAYILIAFLSVLLTAGLSIDPF